MKKKIVLYFLILFLCIFPVLLVNANEITCKYRYVSNDNSEATIFSVRYVVKYATLFGTKSCSGVDTSIGNNSSIKLFLEGAYYGVDAWQTLCTQLDSDLNLTTCPDLWYYEENGKTTVSPSNHRSYNNGSNNVAFSPLDHVDEDGEVIVGDNSNTNDYTTCYVQVGYKDMNGKLLSDDTQLIFTVVSYKNGEVMLQYGNAKTYLKKTSGGENDIATSLNIASNGLDTDRINILNKDIDNLKSMFPYGAEECPEKIYLNKYDSGDYAGLGKDYTDWSVSENIDKELSNYEGSTKSDVTNEDPSATPEGDGNVDFFPNTDISLEDKDCNELLSEDLISFIQSAWNIVKVASVVITILFGIFEFLGSTSKDKDVLMESVNKTIKRLIILLIIILLPTIIDIIGGFIGKNDILCGIR